MTHRRHIYVDTGAAPCPIPATSDREADGTGSFSGNYRGGLAPARKFLQQNVFMPDADWVASRLRPW
jgi:hypothetical protein